MQIPPDSPRRGPNSGAFGAPPSQPLRGQRSQPQPGESSQPLRGKRSQPQSGALSQPRRLPMSELVDDRMEQRATRVRQRAWLVTTVVLAQALITIMIMPGYLISTANLPVLLPLGLALVFYLAAYLVNRLRHDSRVANVILIGGGALATAAQVFVMALISHDGPRTGQAALLFLPLTLEAGLFFTPDLTLIVASAFAIVIASGVILAFALSSDSTPLSEIYLVVVYSLGLEGFIGYLAWRLAQFIEEKVSGALTTDDGRLARALQGNQRQITTQQRQLMQDVGAIQFAVSSALAHDYNNTRIDVGTPTLAPLATSLSMLFQQVRATNELEVKLQRLESQAVPLVEIAIRLATGAAPMAGSELPTDSAFYPVAAALNQALVINTRRQSRLQEVAAELSGTLKHSREGLSNTANESTRSAQQVGKLGALIENLVTTSQRQIELLAQARRALALVLPPEITQADLDDPSLREPVARETEALGGLQGLGDDIGIMRQGFTEEMNVLEPIDYSAAGISPLTTPLRAVDALDGNATSADSASTMASADLPAGLADAWAALTQLHAQTANEARAVGALNHDIGLLKRYVRQTGMGIDWIAQAIDAIERNSDRMQQLASLSGAAIDPLDDPNASNSFFGGRPAAASTPRHAPLVTRPLEGDMRLTQDADVSYPAGPAASDVMSRTPGTLRVSDLVGLDVLGSAGNDPAAMTGAQDEADADADPRA